MLDVLEEQVKELELLADGIEKNAVYLFKNVPIKTKMSRGTRMNYKPVSYSHRWENPSDELQKLQDKLIKDYQNWFSSSYYLIKEYLPDRAKEFSNLYGGLNGIVVKLQLSNYCLTGDKNQYIYNWRNSFIVQRGILSGIPLLAKIKKSL